MLLSQHLETDNHHSHYFPSSHDNDNHIFSSHINAGQAILTFSSSLKQDTYSLHLSDIAHHHLALAVLISISFILYTTAYKTDILHTLQHVNSQFTSLHFQLSYSASFLSVCCQLLAQHIYSLAPYPYLSYDYVSTVTHYVHHSWIASFLTFTGFCTFQLIHG